MRSKTLLFQMLFLVIALAFSTGEVLSQAVYGSIFGTVTDQTGAAIPGAEVTITDVGRGTVYQVTTNQDGNYSKERLIPGKYQVSISAAGFKKAVVEVNVLADIAARTNVVLEPGAVTEEVTVTAEAPVLKTDRSDVATTFNERQVEELPIFQRNFTAFQLLTPGTQRLMWQHASSENPQGSIQIMVNGQHFSGTSFQLDGTDNRDPILGIIVINPTLESVTETKVTTQNYDAEFGQALAAVVTAQTKSGTNEVHGSAFLFRRNDETSARDPFAQATRDPLTGKFIPDTIWNQFGGSLGGPIIKNKTFAFGDYQGTRAKNGRSILDFTPTAAIRSGDLSAFLQPAPGAPMVMTTTGQMVPFQTNMVFDPTTGNPATGAGRRVFADPSRATPSNPLGLNIIPLNRLSPQALNILKLLPMPTRAGATANNFTGSGAETFNANQFNIRTDHYSSGKLHFFGRYSYAKFDKSGRGLYEVPGGPAVGGNGLTPDGFAGTSNTRNHSIAGGFDYTVSPSVLTDFRFGFFRYHVVVAPNGVGTTPAKDAGIPGLNLGDNFTSGMPEFNIGQGTAGAFRFGYALGTNRCNCPLLESEQQFQWVNNWTWLRGNHSIKWGADIRYAQNLRVPSDAHRAGQLNFRADRTQLPGVGGGLGIASFLLGEVSSFERFVSTVTDAGERQKRWFFYGQDTWRVTPKLTLNYGLRYEIYFPQTVTGKGAGGFVDINTGQVLAAGFGNIDRNFNVDTNPHNFAPRLGITYQLMEKTVLRLGYARSYDIGVFGSIFGHSVTQNLPVLARQNLNPAQNFLSVFNLQNGPPAFTAFFGLNAPPNRGGTPNTAIPSNGRFFLPDGVNQFIQPPRMRLGVVDAWNVTIQHQLTPTLSLELAYVANKGTHVFTDNSPDYNLNQPRILNPGEDPNVFTQNVRRPFFPRFGWSQDFRYHANDSSNNYNSLQLKVEKRFSQGYNFLAHYTYSRGFNFDGDYYIHNPRLNYGVNDFDHTHYFVFNNLWELPFGRGKPFLGNASRLADLIVGGWQINSTTTWTSGLPFSPSMANCGALRDTGPCRPNLVGNTSVSNQSQFGWFRVGLGSGTPWASPAPRTFGTAGRNSLRGPRFFNTDLSFFKNVGLTERVKLQFRAEAFNIWNNVNLNNPNNCVNCDPATDGKIFSLAPGAAQRQWQFALKLSF